MRHGEFESLDVIDDWQDAFDRRRAEASFAVRNTGFVTTVGKDGESRGNELILWNYLVGSAELRKEHHASLAGSAPGWRAELRRNPLLRVKIVGSASGASGDSRRNEIVARGRAERVRQTLSDRHAIPRRLIVIESEADRLPLADEIDPDNPLNMARDRRVTIFLFMPGRLVERIDRVSVPFWSIVTTLDREPSRRVLATAPLVNQFLEKLHGIGVDATATWSGPPDASIGFIQLLIAERRLGVYRAGGSRRPILDFGRCTVPFLPCRDQTDAADPLSVKGEAGTGRFERVRLHFLDAPAIVLPVKIVDPVLGPALLSQSRWAMVFVLLFGVRRGESFLPLEYVRWRLLSVRQFPGGSSVRGPIVFIDRRGQGAPAALDFDQAMAGATCRLRARSIDRPRARTPVDECTEIPAGRACPPRVCAAHVTRS